MILMMVDRMNRFAVRGSQQGWVVSVVLALVEENIFFAGFWG